MKYHNELLKKLGQPEAKMYPAVSASFSQSCPSPPEPVDRAVIARINANFGGRAVDRTLSSR